MINLPADDTVNIRMTVGVLLRSMPALSAGLPAKFDDYDNPARISTNMWSNTSKCHGASTVRDVCPTRRSVRDP